ncbi:unnamed protein product [Rotaria socialis]|uniref:Uncharacterized protein n=2 Tax=Rotaria socialis TaxID=392032 RepID=A0A817YVA7_9BILA|nr:unnamed protein product [Rotaria socialis]CAF3382935.1 unnamed protein product [Rotaria socialis]CAF3403635.1 unnamed protein product [Rotaria socialis]CAF3416419.1 unnamed protein product [Rotaria socialis]
MTEALKVADVPSRISDDEIDTKLLSDRQNTLKIKITLKMDMHHALVLFLLTLALQQATHVQSFITYAERMSNETLQINPPRHHQIPLTDQSFVLVAPAKTDEINFTDDESDNSHHIGKIVTLYKRRNGVPLFGRRWIPGKRRVPLYG